MSISFQLFYSNTALANFREVFVGVGSENKIVKGSQKQKIKIFLFPNMIELFKTNQTSHFPPFYDDFFYRNLTLKIGYFILQ